MNASFRKKVKSLFFYITIILFSSSSYGYENFDECGLLLSEINKNFHELSLDEPSFNLYESYYLKRQVENIALNKWKKKYTSANAANLPFMRTKENYVIVESTHSHLRDENFKANSVIYSYDGIKTSKMNDKEITDAYLKSGKFQIINLESGEIFDYDEEGEGSSEVKMVYVHIKPITISDIDTLSGTFHSSYEFTQSWYNYKINTLADKVYQKAIKHNKDNTDYDFFCFYNKKQLGNLYIPDLILKNKTKDGEKTNINYVLTYSPKLEDEESSTIIEKKVLTSSEFQVNFDFRTFPFDKQFLKFEIENNTINAEPVSIDWSWYLPEQIQNFNSLQLMEWKKHDIDINYYTESNFVKGTWHDVLEVYIIIERYFHYFLFKIILPVFLILVLAWSTFWINAREIESRLTVSVVCFLSLVAYTFVIDESLPKLPYLTVLDAIILLAYVFSAIPTFQSIYSFILLEKNGIEFANKLDKRFQKYIPITFIIFVSFIFIFFVSGSKNTIHALTY